MTGTAACALAAPSAALGHTQYSTHPEGSYVQVDGHSWMKACDRDVDGHRVRGWYDHWWAPGSYYQTAWAPSQGCTEPIGIGQLRSFRVCVEDEGCTAWKSVS